MQITDEMVEAARDSLTESSGKTYFPSNYQIRTALEAALGAKSKNTSEIVTSLRMACGYSNITDEVRKSCSHASNGLVIDAAACIEDLAAALRPLDLRRARDVLEKWGLK